MTAADVTVVEEIEQQFPSPWTKAQISVELERNSGISLVAEKDENVLVGWCCGMVFPPETELLKIAVLRESQRMGVARLLLHHFLQFVEASGVEQIFLELRSANTPALQLYRRFGWQVQGIRKNYYTNPADDATLLIRSLKQ